MTDPKRTQWTPREVTGLVALILGALLAAGYLALNGTLPDAPPPLPDVGVVE